MKIFAARKGNGFTRRPQINPRVQMFAHSLTREQRAAVASRPRFYSMPHLRRTGEPDADNLML